MAPFECRWHRGIHSIVEDCVMPPKTGDDEFDGCIARIAELRRLIRERRAGGVNAERSQALAVYNRDMAEALEALDAGKRRAAAAYRESVAEVTQARDTALCVARAAYRESVAEVTQARDTALCVARDAYQARVAEVTQRYREIARGTDLSAELATERRRFETIRQRLIAEKEARDHVETEQRRAWMEKITPGRH
ncbi:MAG: hypothetical protein ACYDBH_01155 [Acidobacteriaceae bacterium]